ncbi:Asp23/Gls24 family envelope stress response protein [Asanoa sp. NPDC049573]|uniref:Asp23/Gls24 family envelope stress response protein n=1 Tax=Asanoa sp. NPDC049573 TaxID=3155396 RepID=UPI00343EC072
MTDERPAGAAEPRLTPATAQTVAEASPAPPTTRQDPDYLGQVVISERVVAKLAAQAVYETPRAGAAAPRLFGSVMPGAGHMGIRASDLAAPPKVNAQIDASVVYIDMAISVRWPESLSEVTGRIRDTVEDRIKAWTGLTVARVRISVTDLVADGVS